MAVAVAVIVVVVVVIVSPTKSGVTILLRDHVLITSRVPLPFTANTFLSKDSSTNAPFFAERAIVYHLISFYYLLFSSMFSCIVFYI